MILKAHILIDLIFIFQTQQLPVPLYPSDLNTTCCELRIIPSLSPSREQYTFYKEHSRKEEKNKLKYTLEIVTSCWRQSQTQAVTACLHCSRKSVGSSSVSDDFETNLSRKTWSDASADKQELSGRTDTEGISGSAPEARQRLGKGQPPQSARFSLCHQKDDDRSQSAAPLLPLCTLTAFMSKNVFTDCVLSSSKTTGTTSGRNRLESAHVQGFQRISHRSISDLLWEQAGQAGKILLSVFPPVIKRFPSLFSILNTIYI